MSDLAKKFNLNEDSISYYNNEGYGYTDSINREKLKNVISEHGFIQKIRWEKWE